MYTKYISEILQELQECLSSGSTAEFAMIGQLIDQAEKIFVAGMGRTGYVMKGFTMRLEQAGYEAYWIGDTNTRSEERRVGQECRSRWSPYH